VSIRVRAYVPEDCGTLATLYRRSIRELAGNDYTPEQIFAWAPDRLDMERFAAKLVSRPTFVAEIGGAAAGFTDLEPDGHIDLFFVNPDHARRGVARALLDHVIARAREQKLTRLYAEVSRTARPVFERHDFTLLGAQEVEIRGQKLQNFRMERRL
jgi:putative acetyltransferase